MGAYDDQGQRYERRPSGRYEPVHELLGLPRRPEPTLPDPGRERGVANPLRVRAVDVPGGELHFGDPVDVDTAARAAERFTSVVSPTAWSDVDAAELVHRKRRRTREEWALLWLKSACWRLISTSTLFLVAWLLTGSVRTGGVVALIHMVITIVIYVPHDLAWERYSARRTARRHRRSSP